MGHLLLLMLQLTSVGLLTNANVKNGGKDEANSENEKGHLRKSSSVFGVDLSIGVGVASQEDEHEHKNCDIGNNGDGIAKCVQFNSFR